MSLFASRLMNGIGNSMGNPNLVFVLSLFFLGIERLNPLFMRQSRFTGLYAHNQRNIYLILLFDGPIQQVKKPKATIKNKFF